MSPSTSIQSRISAFEALKDQKQTLSKPKIINGFGDLVDGAGTPGDASNILEEPISPTAESFSTIAPSPTPSPLNRVHSLSGSDAHSPSPSPPGLGRKTSLLDLNDWVVDVEGPNVSPVTGKGTGPIGGVPRWWQPPPSPTASINTCPLPPRRKDMPERPAGARTAADTAAPLIQLESDVAPPKSKSAPPIPPKKIPANKLTNGNGVVSSRLAGRDPSSSTSVSPTPPTLPLPKRADSLTVEPQHVYPPFLKLDSVPNGRGRHAPASSVSSFHSVSLSDSGDTGTPNSVTNFVFTYPMDRSATGNTNGSGNNGSVHGGDNDSGSLDESFENVSAISSSYSYDFTYGSFPPSKSQVPPRLPERPNKLRAYPPANPTPVTQTAVTSPPRSPIHLPLSRISSSSSTASSRRMPPPPPPPHRNSSVASRTTTSSRASPPSTTASDRSSILSTATTGTSYTGGSSHTPTINNGAIGVLNPKLVRQPPIPASARRRYEKLFYANVDARKKAKPDNGFLGVPGAGTSSPTSIKKARKAAGWRGLSVDLITNPDENLPSLPPSQSGSRRGSMESADSGWMAERGKGDRLEGVIVRRIWMCSGLDREKLRAIWNDSDGSDTGLLDADAFVKAMWRIDEELRKARLSPASFSPNSGCGSLPRRQPRRIGSVLR